MNIIPGYPISFSSPLHLLESDSPESWKEIDVILSDEFLFDSYLLHLKLHREPQQYTKNQRVASSLSKDHRQIPSTLTPILRFGVYGALSSGKLAPEDVSAFLKDYDALSFLYKILHSQS